MNSRFYSSLIVPSPFPSPSLTSIIFYFFSSLTAIIPMKTTMTAASSPYPVPIDFVFVFPIPLCKTTTTKASNHTKKIKFVSFSHCRPHLHFLLMAVKVKKKGGQRFQLSPALLLPSPFSLHQLATPHAVTLLMTQSPRP